ncbi:hypothetical protein B0H14DRAFT_2579766 [Mycena olivaceomarginata]|nr:hypothetical protein B0H14DRAFT_2579766 [Mycena olivaceomarginata]
MTTRRLNSKPSFLSPTSPFVFVASWSGTTNRMLSGLHKLTLTSTTDAVVLEWFTLPRLDALHVFVPSVNPAWFNHSPYLPAFLAFLARSGCPLTHLSLSVSGSDEEPGPLDLAGYLVPLAAHIVALRYDFLQPAESPFLGALLDRLESVSLMETALEEMYVRFPGHDMDGFLGFPAEVYERLIGLKKGGMSITVAKYEYWSEEKGREPDQILFD